MIVYGIDTSSQHLEEVGGSNISLLATHSRLLEAVEIHDCNITIHLLGHLFWYIPL